jgi:transposase-like protein
VHTAAEDLVSPQKLARKSRILTDSDRFRIVLESFAGRARVSDVARRNRVNPRELSRWRRSYRLGKLGGVDTDPQTVPVSELTRATQRIRELERELGRMALENAMLLEAVEFAGLPVSGKGKAVALKRRKK